VKSGVKLKLSDKSISEILHLGEIRSLIIVQNLTEYFYMP